MITIPVIGAVAAQRKIRHLHQLDMAENAGTPAAATVLLRDTDASGEIRVHLELAANESKQLSWDPPKRFANGLYVQVSAGSVRGSIVGE